MLLVKGGAFLKRGRITCGQLGSLQYSMRLCMGSALGTIMAKMYVHRLQAYELLQQQVPTAVQWLQIKADEFVAANNLSAVSLLPS